MLPHYPIRLQKIVAQELPEPEVVDSYLVTPHRFFFPEPLSGLLNTLRIFSDHKIPVLRTVLHGEKPWYRGFEMAFKGLKRKPRAP